MNEKETPTFFIRNIFDVIAKNKNMPTQDGEKYAWYHDTRQGIHYKIKMGLGGTYKKGHNGQMDQIGYRMVAL